LRLRELYLSLGQWSVRTVLIFTVFAANLVAADKPAGLALEETMRKAVFIVVDGIPADVLERVHTPNLDLISAAGGYTRAFVGGAVGTQTESPTVSAVGYQSLLTGTWANKHKVLDNEVSDPDYRYWDIFRIAKAVDQNLRTALFSTWEYNRTRLLGDTLQAAGGSKLDHFVDGMEYDLARFPHDPDALYIRAIDEHVATSAAEYISEQGPDLSWVYFQYTDDIGHFFGDSREQDEALQLTDAWVGEIWKVIQQRQEVMAEDWLIIVTTDHGRTRETGKDHGGQSQRERTTWISTNSGHLNGRFSQTPGIVDIVPSIVNHLDLQVPELIRSQLDGQAFIDRF
jgi:predicted AlkP superfamily pyrophosphatase or phosphodiesterase